MPFERLAGSDTQGVSTVIYSPGLENGTVNDERVGGYEVVKRDLCELQAILMRNWSDGWDTQTSGSVNQGQTIQVIYIFSYLFVI